MKKQILLAAAVAALTSSSVMAAGRSHARETSASGALSLAVSTYTLCLTDARAQNLPVEDARSACADLVKETGRDAMADWALTYSACSVYASSDFETCMTNAGYEPPRWWEIETLGASHRR